MENDNFCVISAELVLRNCGDAQAGANMAQDSLFWED